MAEYGTTLDAEMTGLQTFSAHVLGVDACVVWFCSQTILGT
jgi:hypothetical protein